jgi:predicted O-methyltransferase YrrM
LGTYFGYSALRMARVLPREARLYSVDSTPQTRRSRAASLPTRA